MSPLNKSLISLAITFAVSGTSIAATDTSSNSKVVRADFKNKVLLIPCVEVTDSPFDGFYNVLMEISGDGSGLDWKVKQVNPAAEGECDSAPSLSSTDDLLKSMGMPSITDLIKNVGQDDGDVEPTPTPSPTQTSIENSVNNAIDSAIPKQ